jgi:hypothetical protein
MSIVTRFLIFFVRVVVARNLPVYVAGELYIANGRRIPPGPSVCRFSAGLVSHDVPAHVKVISRGTASKKQHYALVCFSDVPLALERGGPRFDPMLCRTPAGKTPGSSRVTALLRGSPEGHPNGQYEICFRATLVAPWTVKLVHPISNQDVVGGQTAASV